MIAKRKKKKGVDPEKKSPSPNYARRGSGSGAKISRNDKGDLVARKDKDYYDTAADQAYRRELAATKGDRTFDGAVGPRVGGVEVKARDGAVKGGTKSMISKAKRRVKKSAASPQAKRSAIRALRNN